ncbi:MAG: energy transducer TonB [Pseudomonadota bacterium]|nr:energy transducer TonB [Pseudomonadota bacterium]
MHSFRYSSGYQPAGGLRPGSIGLTLLVGGGLVTAMTLVSPTFHRLKDTILTTYVVHPDPVPPVDPPPPRQKPKDVVRQKHIAMPPPDPVTHVDRHPEIDYSHLPPLDASTGGDGGGTAIFEPPYTPPNPVLVGVGLDPRYAGYLQPPYPAAEQRAEHEGRVTVRVLVGVDGRVKQVERVAAASDAFFAATERQALGKWRFKPATRDGIPVEAWKVMNVSFVLSGAE